MLVVLPVLGAAAQATGPVTIRVELVSVPDGKLVQLSPKNKRAALTVGSISRVSAIYPVAYDHGVAIFSLPPPAPPEVYPVADHPWINCKVPDPVNVDSVLAQGAATPAEGRYCFGVTQAQADALSKRFPPVPGLIIIFVHKINLTRWPFAEQTNQPGAIDRARFAPPRPG